LDLTIRALLNHNIGEVLKLAHAIDLWLATHLTDFMDKLGHIDDYRCLFAEDLREYLVLSYSEFLFSHESLWSIAIEYLNTCPTYGSHYLAKMIEQVPLDSDLKVNKVITLCEKYHMVKSASLIHQTVAMQKFYKEQYGEAIYHYVQAGDVESLNEIVDHLLHKYSDKGEIEDDLLVGSIAMYADRSPLLSFLVHYHDFFILKKEEEITQAASLLIDLLTSPVSPKPYWRFLLPEVLSMLQKNPSLFDAAELHKIMNCLERITSPYFEDSKEINLPVDQIQSLRLFLANGLAYSMMDQMG